MGWGIVPGRGPWRTGVTVFVGFGGDDERGGGLGLGLGGLPEASFGMAVALSFRVFVSSFDGAVGYLAIWGAQSWWLRMRESEV